ncbi:hypothetical protein ABEP17_12200 [Priestia flexa]|uniref:Membrane protein YkvI n=1 Tax=Priestia flexa TaxID=86664 RepID=A0ABU4J800_9BACI|nr:hypothetical protein [Priestia flexa]AQX53013.1 hypothetical protein BC359_01045 [Priestia flexa]MBY6088551.1 hypothetical protein [Priestia flexa]MCG7314499.1 hypothetical protein [Priestia flexa]MCM3067521.1 hypothetical protein [Priestia flexa]MDW8517135.1 hypothetical protein [Priestia flexa]
MLKQGFKWMFLILGTIIGAGYASGRELWQFFGEESGLALLLFTVIFIICCNVIMSISFQLKTNQFYPLLIEVFGKRWAFLYDSLIIFYLFSTTVIMIAGGGATLETFQLPYWLGIMTFSLLIILVFIKGIQGMLSINSYIMPVLVIGLISVLLFFILKSQHVLDIDWHHQHNWSSGFTFTALNILPLVAVLTTIGNEIKTKVEIHIASIGSGLLIGGLSFVYNESLLQVSDLLPDYEIPLFAIMKSFPFFMLIIMSVLLLVAIYTTAVSGILGLTTRFRRSENTALWKMAIIFVIIMIPFTKLGFSKLIAVLYPLYGMVNLFLLAALLIYPIRNIYKN